ncbi:L,D-transpeptidase family protein [Halobacteriovorax sp. HLS]|uniref:L,D-transpeptidase family protein n=1 Tax=Halobacteriovorax sp. HLS TaxID=2234000 RepID=UPI0013E2F8FB|nr:L,D-transpeptidase [Halobacteriovorax sp. HLS]
MKLATRFAAFALVLGTIAGPVSSVVITDANASIFSSRSDWGWKSLQLPKSAENKVIGVRVEDVVKHLPTIAPGLDYIYEKLEKGKKEYFSDKGKVDEVLNLFFNDTPKWKNGVVRLDMTALIKYSEDDIAFKNIIVEYKNDDVKNFTVSPKKFTELSSTKLTFDVALKSRKIIVKDLYSNIKMIFPLGVGSFDEAVLNDEFSLLTPRFKDGYLDKSTTIKNRKKPRYFAGLPFIRILKGKSTSNDYTGIGFHAQPFPDKNDFIRAFDSHGCMRMQTPDLWSLYYLVSAGPTQQLPITVNYSSEDKSEHPFPKRNKPYKRVANYGSVSAPDFTIDRDNLVLVHNNWEDSAPVEKLYDSSDDNYHDVFNYSTSEHLAAKRERVEKECKAISYDNDSYKVLWEDYAPDYDEDDSERQRERKLKRAKKKFDKAKEKMDEKVAGIYSECMSQLQRDRSVGDRLYRWWVH